MTNQSFGSPIIFFKRHLTLYRQKISQSPESGRLRSIVTNRKKTLLFIDGDRDQIKLAKIRGEEIQTAIERRDATALRRMAEETPKEETRTLLNLLASIMDERPKKSTRLKRTA